MASEEEIKNRSQIGFVIGGVMPPQLPGAITATSTSVRGKSNWDATSRDPKRFKTNEGGSLSMGDSEKAIAIDKLERAKALALTISGKLAIKSSGK